MKAGLIIYGDINTVSGGYLYDRMLVRELKRSGIGVEVISLPWRNYARHLLDNVDPALKSRLAKLKVDILLQDELNHPSLFVLNRHIRRNLNVPIVSIVHHLRCHEQHPAGLMPLYKTVEQRYLRSVDGYLVNSWTTRRAVETFISKKSAQSSDIAARSFLVAYPAGDHLPAPDWEIVRRRIHTELSSGPKLRLIFIGNVIARKALHTVVGSLALLKRSHPHIDFDLQVIGSMDIERAYAQSVATQVSQLGLGQSISFHGRISDHHLAHLLSTANLLIMPSFEGFGIVYLEAMRHGLCPVASTLGAAQEIVRQGENGFLTPPASPEGLVRLLVELFNQPERLHHCRLAALETCAAHPDWSQTFSAAPQWLRELTMLKAAAC